MSVCSLNGYERGRPAVSAPNARAGETVPSVMLSPKARSRVIPSTGTGVEEAVAAGPEAAEAWIGPGCIGGADPQPDRIAAAVRLRRNSRLRIQEYLE